MLIVEGGAAAARLQETLADTEVDRTINMAFDFGRSQELLKEANEHFAGMLPVVSPQLGRNSVAEHAKEYVAAVGALQQELLAFAAPVPNTKRAQLEQEVTALQQEVARADGLLQEASVLVQQWHQRCQSLRDQHEAVLTQGIGGPAAQHPTAPKGEHQ